jgi:hypothetical protein
MTVNLAALVAERIDDALAGGRVPQVVLDLDGTLFDNVPRSKASLMDAARHAFGEGPLENTIRGISEAAFEYNPIDTLRKHGVRDEETLERLRDEWAKRFFGSTYLTHDVPLAGAVDAATRWWSAGAELNYLTGRHVPEMFLGTCRSLHDEGFPIGTLRTQLLMKPAFDHNDVEFKITTVPSIRRKGPIVLIVDNDPRVINPLSLEVPEAAAVMMETLHPVDAPVLAARVIRAPDFRVFLPGVAGAEGALASDGGR